MLAELKDTDINFGVKNNKVIKIDEPKSERRMLRGLGI